jgi:hypothetical protein
MCRRSAPRRCWHRPHTTCVTTVLLRASGQLVLSGPCGTTNDELRAAPVYKPLPSRIYVARANCSQATASQRLIGTEAVRVEKPLRRLRKGYARD